MPPLDFYKRTHAVSNNGMARKIESDMIMDATFTESINYCVGYFYDYYHDNNLTILNDLDSSHDSNKIPIELQFYESTQQTMDKDTVSKHIMFRPNQKCPIDYYDELYAERYGAEFPLGLYVDLADKNGILNRWLVVAKANDNSAMTSYEVLRCDYVFQYIANNTRYQVPGVIRSQNSYNRYCCVA